MHGKYSIGISSHSVAIKVNLSALLSSSSELEQASVLLQKETYPGLMGKSNAQISLIPGHMITISNMRYNRPERLMLIHAGICGE